MFVGSEIVDDEMDVEARGDTRVHMLQKRREILDGDAGVCIG
jgi:hypothetical protein